MRQKSQVHGIRSRRSRRLAVENSFLQPEQTELELLGMQRPPIDVTPLAAAAQIPSDSSSDRPSDQLNAPNQSQSPCSSFVRSAASYVPNSSPAEASSGCTKKRRGRGPTCMRNVWEQLGAERKCVSFNSLGQPNDVKTTSILANFLGTVARNGENAPLHYLTWKKMPESYKEEMMKIVKLKFDIPEIGEEFVIKSLANKWRGWKCTLKKMYFDPAKSVEEHLSKVPERVDKEQWKQLVLYWSSEEGKNIAETNRTIRRRQVINHCMGTRSFAVVKEKEKEKLGRDPSRADMFIACYAKPDGTPISQVAGEKIDKMKELLSKDLEGSSEDIDMIGSDVYSKVMGKDKPGFIRTYGLGVTYADVHGKRRRASYALALEYKSAFEKMKMHCGELSKKLEEMQNNSGGAQTPTTNPQNCSLASTSMCRALQMAMSLQEDYWSTEHLELFCKLCIEQIDKKGSHLNEGVWRKISEKFEELTGKKHDSGEMKNTWENLKEEWENWKQLMKGEAEMGWDSQKQTVGASEEWWKHKIQMNPVFRGFRAKGIPPDFESLLDCMFMNVSTTVNGAWKGSQDSPSNFGNDFAPVDSDSDDDMNSTDNDVGEIIAQLNKGKEAGTFSPQEVATFSPSTEEFAAADSSSDGLISLDFGQSNTETRPRKSKKPMLNKIEKLKVKMKKKKNSRGESKSKKHLNKIESKSVAASLDDPRYDEIMELLDEIPEIECDDELHFFALDHLKERLNQVIFKRFKNQEKRASWLKHEFKKQSR